jgi:hypothetical protein
LRRVLEEGEELGFGGFHETRLALHHRKSVG